MQGFVQSRLGENSVNTQKSIFMVLSILMLSMLACQVGGVMLDRNLVVGSGNVESQERSVSDVERVRLTALGDLTIIQGNQEGLTVEADDNLLPYIETEMRGRELVIGIKDGIQVEPNSPIHITLQVKTLDQVVISGSGNVYAESLDTGDLTLEVSGSGNMTFDELKAEDLRLRTSGSGNFTLAGEVQTQDISISGSGNVKGGDLASRDAEVTISGSGNVTVWVSEKLDINVTGVGNVDYYGQPEVSQRITGGGEINSLGEHP
jgi:hypothetical protein